MNTNITTHFAHIANIMEDCVTLVRAIRSHQTQPNLIFANMEQDIGKYIPMLRENIPPAERHALTDAEMEDLYQRLGGKPKNPTVNETKIRIATLKNSEEQSPPVTPAMASYNKLVRKVAMLEQWEKDEIDQCRQELNNLLANHQSSAKLAIVAASLGIAIDEGQ